MTTAPRLPAPSELQDNLRRIERQLAARKRLSAPPPPARIAMSRMPAPLAVVTAPNAPVPNAPALTFEVYTPEAIRAGRRPMPSAPEFTAPTKSQTARNVGAGLLGAALALFLAATVIAIVTVSDGEADASPSKPDARVEFDRHL